MGSVKDFVYERLGRHLVEGEPGDWANKCIFTSADGRKTSLRGPGGVQVLVTEFDVYVHTSFAAPDNLPSHIKWGKLEVPPKQIALRNPAGLGVWYGCRLSNVGWAEHADDAVLNTPDSVTMRFYEDSGRKCLQWRPSVIEQLIPLLESATGNDISVTALSRLFRIEAAQQKVERLSDKDSRFYAGLTPEQKRASKKSFSIIATKQPESLLHGNLGSLVSIIEGFTNKENV